MAEAATETPTSRDRIWNEIVRLGIEEYVADLDANGYTVIPPEIAMPKGLAERMLQACLDVAERRNGERPDFEGGATHASMTPYQSGFDSFQTRRERKLKLGLNKAAAYEDDSPHGDLMNSILFEDEVFEEGLMNPVLLAITTYLCGHSATLSSMGCWMRGPNRSTFNLHTDMSVPDELLGPFPFVCQCTYVLTDFDREKGATAFVPGSHKWCRPGRRRVHRPRRSGRLRQPGRGAGRGQGRFPADLAREHLARRVQPQGAGTARERGELHGPRLHAHAGGPARHHPPGNARPASAAFRDSDTAGSRGRLSESGRRLGQGRAGGEHNAAYAKESGVRFRPKDDIYN